MKLVARNFTNISILILYYTYLYCFYFENAMENYVRQNYLRVNFVLIFSISHPLLEHGGKRTENIKNI